MRLKSKPGLVVLALAACVAISKLAALAEVAPSSLPASGREAKPPSIEELSLALQQIFKGVRSLEFQSEQRATTFATGEWLHTTTLHFIAEGSKYRHVISQDSGGRDADGTEACTFDGEQSNFLYYRRLSIKNGPPANHRHLLHSLGLLEPFEWLFRHSETFPTLHQLSEQDLWKAQLEGVTIESVVRDGKPLTHVTFPPAESFGEVGESVFEFYLPQKKGSPPVALTRTSADGGHRIVYEINEVAKVKLDDREFCYPKVATRKIYYGPGETPHVTITIEVTNVQVNFDPAPGAFRIDPSAAKQIFDTDSGMHIQVND